jgi:predicted transcriptional regulator
MAAIQEKIESWGKEHIGKSSVSEVMKHLRQKKEMGKRDIAKLFGCSIPTVRYYMAKAGIMEVREGFVEKIKGLGHKSTASFFTDPKNTHRTMKELAKELGFCYPTVSKYYYEFLKEKEGKKSK